MWPSSSITKPLPVAPPPLSRGSPGGASGDVHDPGEAAGRSRDRAVDSGRRFVTLLGAALGSRPHRFFGFPDADPDAGADGGAAARASTGTSSRLKLLTLKPKRLRCAESPVGMPLSPARTLSGGSGSAATLRPMRILVVDDEPAVRDVARARAAPRGLRGRRSRRTASEALRGARDATARRDRARRADAAARRPRGLPPAARGGRPHADPDADRARRGRRPRRRPRRRRRRLPRQAVRARGAARAPARAAAPRRRRRRTAARCASPTSTLDPARTRSGAASARSS